MKNIKYEYKAVHLLNNDQAKDEYSKLNPMKSVPTIEVNGHALSQSSAIIEYLEDLKPNPSLLPEDPFLRGKCRQLCAIIGSDIQPIQNLSVLNYVKQNYLNEHSQQDKDKLSNEWARHWISRGLKAYEQEVSSGLSGKYSIGHSVTMADLFLIPQLFNARRFGYDFSETPTLLKIEKELSKLEAVVKAHPDHQPDSPEKQQTKL